MDDPFERLAALRHPATVKSYDALLLSLVRAARIEPPAWRTDAFDTLPMSARLAVFRWQHPPANYSK